MNIHTGFHPSVLSRTVRVSGMVMGMLLCLAWVGCSSVVDDDDEVVERVQVGDHVPSLTVSVVDGGVRRTFSTDALTGQTVIVLFNTACSDCQRELPRLNSYYVQHRDEAGFQMVAISREEGEESVAAYWSANGLQIPYSAQADRSVYSLFASSVIPRVYFCTAEGVVTRIYVEALDETFGH